MISIESSVTSPFWTPFRSVAMVQLWVPSGNPHDAHDALSAHAHADGRGDFLRSSD